MRTAIYSPRDYEHSLANLESLVAQLESRVSKLEVKPTPPPCDHVWEDVTHPSCDSIAIIRYYCQKCGQHKIVNKPWCEQQW